MTIKFYFFSNTTSSPNFEFKKTPETCYNEAVKTKQRETGEMNENEIIRIYSIADDFIKALEKDPKKESICASYNGKRGPKRQLSIAEVITLNIIRYNLRVNDLKVFHQLAQQVYKSYFPKLPNYENFLKASNKCFEVFSVFLQFLLAVNRTEQPQNCIKYMDSTALPVCTNQNISTHKVTKGYASRGKTTKGWFYGFKLHGVCTRNGKLLNVLFSAGNVHDSASTQQVTGQLHGFIVCDAGYLLKKDVFNELYNKHIHIFAAARNNMKKLMTKGQQQLLKNRSCIETVWGVLKQRFSLVFNFARSMTGLFRHYCACLCAFLLSDFVISS